LDLIFTSDLPHPVGTTVATFADDTAIMAVGGDVEEATTKLQRAADEINNWTRQWLIKRTGYKSTHVNFTNHRCHHISILMNGKPIPHSQTVKYLGMTLDAKLRWKVHVKKKEKSSLSDTSACMGRRSAMSAHNKLVLYKQILKPVWTYGIQLCGCTKPRNIAIIPRFQNNIVNSPWYVRNADLHMEMVTTTRTVC
jgi:hypothetical protein